MHPGIKLVIAFYIALPLASGPAASAAPVDQKELQQVLEQLNLAAENFHSTSADVEFDTVQTDPIYNKDIQKGAVEYKRKGKEFQMAVHFLVEANGVEEGKPASFKPAPKDLTCSGGEAMLYEKLTDQLYTRDFTKYESYLLLGFGASGTELAEKWDIKYLGTEPLPDGRTSVKTVKLELVAKDPNVRNLYPKVTIWIDPARAVSLKQVFDEGRGESRTSYYSNIKLNPALPDSDFKIKTDSKTQIMK
jgi:outer membrane lipoprotein-sorting protein